MFNKKVIGIDLGTSKCCVAYLDTVKAALIENEHGKKTTPSYVAFTDTARLVGEDAKKQVRFNPANTVFGVKQILGKEQNEGIVGTGVDEMPYTVEDARWKKSSICVSYKGTEELLLPQQITAMLLSNMKAVAERHLKSSVEDAVISVPASFTNAQRQATKDAAAIAGLKVLALISEPTAAAFAYQRSRRIKDDETIAVVDFGAGNLSVAFVTVRKDGVTVRALSGTSDIGGNDIDKLLMNYVSSKFEDKFKQKLSESSANTERLRSSCERIKLLLSVIPNVYENLDCFADGNVLPVNINRADFCKMLHELVYPSLINCLSRVIDSSSISEKEISRVLLVGGSSRIPQVQTYLEEIFGTESLDQSVNVDEAVACGAALYAALLSGDKELEDITVDDRVSNEYSFCWQGDSITHNIFEQHSSKTLPLQRRFTLSSQTPFNQRTQAGTFELTEKLFGRKNPYRHIGTVNLYDQFRQAVSLITGINFVVDRCGIINVVVQLDKKHDFPEVVTQNSSKLSKNTLQKARERERQFSTDEVNNKKRLEALPSLQASSFRLRSAMNKEMQGREEFRSRAGVSDERDGDSVMDCEIILKKHVLPATETPNFKWTTPFEKSLEKKRQELKLKFEV